MEENNKDQENNIGGIEFSKEELKEEIKKETPQAPTETEVVAGVELPEEKPIETPEGSLPQATAKPTETVGGVEFSKEEPKKENQETPEPKEESGVPDEVVHTMAEDMGDNANQKQGAVLQTILKEERLRREERKQQQKNMALGLISSVLVLAAIGIFIYISRPEETVVPQTIVVQESVIYAENHTQIDTTETKPITLLSNIAQKITSTEILPGEITNIYFTRTLPQGAKQTLGARQFFSATQSSIPGGLLPLLGNDFMFGVYAGAERLPFMIIEVPVSLSIQQMSGWEDTMLQEVNRVFDLGITDPELYSKSFVDAKIQNKNARILFDENDEIVIGYLYLDNDLIAIATHSVVFQEILQRLATNF